MACAKSHQLPLRVQGEGSDHGGRLALDQSEGLEACRKQNRLFPHIQPSVALIKNTVYHGKSTTNVTVL